MREGGRDSWSRKQRTTTTAVTRRVGIDALFGKKYMLQRGKLTIAEKRKRKHSQKATEDVADWQEKIETWKIEKKRTGYWWALLARRKTYTWMKITTHLQSVKTMENVPPISTNRPKSRASEIVERLSTVYSQIRKYTPWKTNGAASKIWRCPDKQLETVRHSF